MSEINYIEEARSIYSMVKERYTDDDGIIITRFNADDGSIVNPQILTSDFGDYIQNFYYLGKITGNTDIQDWCIQHLIRAAGLYQHPSGFFITNPGSRSISVRENGDTLEGLSTVYCFSESLEILQIINRFINGIDKYRDKKGFIPGSLTGPFTSPFANSDYSGNFIEELAVLADAAQRPEWAMIAVRLLNAWINTHYFMDYGLFPNRVFRKGYLTPLKKPLTVLAGRNVFDKTSLVKSNTNIISGVIELFRQSNETGAKKKYKDILDHWSYGVERFCGENGYYYGIYDFSKHKRKEYRRPLPDNHHVLSAYADIYHITGDERYVRLLKTGCEYWLAHQLDTGFFPESPKQTGHNAERALMDSNLDLSIVFLKAAELLREIKYLHAAHTCINAIVTHMKRPYGYIESVIAKTGESSGQSNLFTKYITLLIKGLLVLDAVLKGRKVYSRDLYLLARDR